MKNFTRIASLLLLVLAFAGLASAQTALTQTTLAADQGCGPSCISSGVSGNYQTFVNLTSATGITQAFNGQPVTFVYIDQELEAIQTTVTGQTVIFNVLRAQQGTKLGFHKSGTMVLIQTISPQFGGQTGSGGFQSGPPPLGGGCLSTATLVTPWVDVMTSYQYLCSTITNTWVPGWSNPLAPGSAKNTTAVASAAGQVTPSGPQFHITGALAITGFLVPVGFNATSSGGGCFLVIPDGTFTWTTANNIAIAGTAVVNKTLNFCWDATVSKFVPSNLS